MDRFKSVAFVVVLLVVGLLNLGLHTNNEKSDVENRPLQMAPNFAVTQLLDGTLMLKIDSYISDQFMFRDHMIELADRIKSLRGFSSDIAMEIVQSDNMIPALPDQEQGEQTPVSIKYFVYEDRAFRSFKMNEAAEKSYAQAILDFKSVLPSTDVFVLVSTTQAAYIPPKYEKYTDSPEASVNRLESLMDGPVNFVNINEIMRENQDQYLFFRTDHHWNGLGAYYAYVAFCEEKLIEPVELSEMKVIFVENFVGSFFRMTNNAILSENPDTIHAYVPDATVKLTRIYMDKEGNTTLSNPVSYVVSEKFMGDKPSYGIFLGGDSAITIVETVGENSSEKILVVKDSYGNAFAPYLVNHYKEVHVLDPRYWQGSMQNYIETHNIDDVIFINNVDINLYDVYDEMLRQVF